MSTFPTLIIIGGHMLFIPKTFNFTSTFSNSLSNSIKTNTTKSSPKSLFPNTSVRKIRTNGTRSHSRVKIFGSNFHSFIRLNTLIHFFKSFTKFHSSKTFTRILKTITYSFFSTSKNIIFYKFFSRTTS